MRAHTPGSRTAIAQPTPNNVGVIKPITVASFDTYLNTSIYLSDDDAYRIAKTLHENWAQLQQAYAALRSRNADEIVAPDSPVPYHDGAIRYYREAALWPPKQSN